MEILAKRNINIIKNSIWSGPGSKKSFDPKKLLQSLRAKLEFVFVFREF